MIQSALGIDDDEMVAGALRSSSNSAQSEPLTAVAAGSSLDKGGLGIELGKVGLRHRSADSMAENEKCSRDEGLKASS